MKENPKAMISIAPTDPTEKKEWASQMARIQYAMWIDDDTINFCCHCKKKYESVDDFISRHPRRGYEGDFMIDDKCWESYVKQNEGRKK